MTLGTIQNRINWLLLTFTALLFSRGFNGAFIWDDITFFVENDILTNLKPWNLQAIFLHPVNYWGENLPFSEFLFVLEYVAFRDFTPAYHVVSLLLYLLLGWQAWCLVGNIHDALYPGRSSPGEKSDSNHFLIISALSFFLLHPTHVEAVAYITGQQHLLYSLFSLLAMNILWSAWKQDRLNSWRYLAAGILCYYLAVLAKYQAVATGIFIPLLWLVMRGKGQGNPLKILGAWFAINIPVVLWLVFSTSGYGSIGQASIPFWAALVRGMRILGMHLVIALKPYPLTFGYPFDGAWTFDLYFYLGLSVVALLAVALLFFRRSVVTIGLLIFVVYFFPVLQIFVEVQNATIYDRYLFMPILGLCLIFATGLNFLATRWAKLKPVIISFTCLVALTLATLTFTYIPKFSSNLASMEHGYRTHPGWFLGAFDYVTELIDAGHPDQAAAIVEAEDSFNQPDWLKSYFLGWIELERGNLEKAISILKYSARLNHRSGWFPYPAVPLGEALLKNGQPDQAALYLNSAWRFPVDYPIQKYRAKVLLQDIAAQKERVKHQER